MRIEQTRKLFLSGILPKPKSTQEIGCLAERLEALRLVRKVDGGVNPLPAIARFALLKESVEDETDEPGLF